MPLHCICKLKVSLSVIGHAENFITRGGLYINQVRVSSTEEMVDKDAHLLVGNITLLRVGECIEQ